MTKTQNWIEEFDKFAGVSKLNSGTEYFGWSYDGVDVPEPKEFKQFIQSLLTRQKEEMIKKVEGMKLKDGIYNHENYTTVIRSDQQNQVLDDVIKEIEE